MSVAAVYFLVASGLTLIFGLMRVITLAHGTSFLLGGYIGYIVVRYTGNWILGAFAAALGVGLLGLLIHQVLIHRFQDDDMRVALITLGVALIGTDLMAGLVLPRAGGAPGETDAIGVTATLVPVPEQLQGTVDIPFVGYFPLLRLLIIAIAVVVGVALALFINRTRLGSIVRAGVDDSQMTAATGVNVRIVFGFIFLLGSALAGFAGIVQGSLLPLLPGLDGTYLLFSLVVVIVGGMGSVPGAAIGAILVGLVSQFALVYVPTWSVVVTFGLMVLVLAIRPQGILGKVSAL
ncbi:MAG TPA: branched-chain amino acid ABC transporter permease [Microbacterium sp.]|uniref:branched-chain amino acid ABC transporter permease n=1 Tax=Microbacterium sp. TaxID=51671 RepID=UPI002C3CD68C|nr:branched-chain amino acid ABC transporter permease [Microbacterium sp.]HWI32174.1 branched-chain amino acid ABC transporter permease [Microbacterium sp.]